MNPSSSRAKPPSALVHCRDKIEFNLKSQKLEEPVLLFWQQTRFCRGVKTLAPGVLQSTENLNFLQLFPSPASLASPRSAARFGGGARKLSNPRSPASGFLEFFSKSFRARRRRDAQRQGNDL